MTTGARARRPRARSFSRRGGAVRLTHGATRAPPPRDVLEFGDPKGTSAAAGDAPGRGGPLTALAIKRAHISKNLWRNIRVSVEGQSPAASTRETLEFGHLSRPSATAGHAPGKSSAAERSTEDNAGSLTVVRLKRELETKNNYKKSQLHVVRPCHQNRPECRREVHGSA